MGILAAVIQLFATDGSTAITIKAIISGLGTLIISFLINRLIIWGGRPTFVTFNDSGYFWTWTISFIIFLIASGLISHAHDTDDWQTRKFVLAIVVVVGLVGYNVIQEAGMPPSTWFNKDGWWGCDTSGKNQMIDLLHVKNVQSLPDTDLHTIILRTTTAAVDAAGKQMPGKYASYLTPNSAYLQKIGNEWLYVVDLKVTDTTGFNSHGGYSPGYFTVSATDPYALAVFHDGYEIHYLTGVGGTTAHDVEQHVYWNFQMNHPEYQVQDLTGGLEVDDNGVPYYTATLLKPVVGVTGFQPVGMITVDTKTGNITPYLSMKSIPTWIDRVYPEEYMVDLANDYWDNYHANDPCHGQGKANQVKKDEENFQAITHPNGQVKGEIVYSYTSINDTDTTMLGELVIDPQTGQTVNYDLSNQSIKFVTVTEAQKQIENNLPVRNGNKLTAEQCGLYQVLSEPTIICSVYNDNSYSGIVFYKARNAAAGNGTQLIFVNNIDDGYAQLQQQTATEQNAGNSNVPSSVVSSHQYTGTVARISQPFIQGNTSYIDFNLINGAKDDTEATIDPSTTFEVKYEGKARLLCPGDSLVITGTVAKKSTTVSVTSITDDAVSKTSCK